MHTSDNLLVFVHLLEGDGLLLRGEEDVADIFVRVGARLDARDGSVHQNAIFVELLAKVVDLIHGEIGSRAEKPTVFL